ncbi:MAG: hypothetical protein GX079_05035 [Tissierellia bacterium]|nr:hypothetical protein [Tissierellia bacterium]
MFNYTVREKRVVVDGTPCLLIEPEGVSRGGVIHYHGLGSKKENHRFMASCLAASGYRVLVPDGLYHGERYEGEKEREIISQVILSNLKEFDALASYLDEEVLFLTGHSMGSMSAGLIFHHRDQVLAASVINGYLSYKDLDLEVPQELLAVDPIDFLDRVGDRHLLILHGEADSSVDIDIQRKYFEQARGYFKEGNLVMEEIPRLDHYITLAMLQRTIEFFEGITP